jgi:membrane protease YdiL (CAAX protease family)
VVWPQGSLSIKNKPAWSKGIKNIAAPLVPYFVIPVGLFVLHSAWAAMLGYHLVMGILLALYRKDLERCFIRPRRGYKITLAMTVAGAAGGVLMYGWWPYLGVPGGIRDFLGEIGLNQSNWAFFLVYFAAVNPWLEELYWRGWLGSSARYPVINDLCFAVYHGVVLAGQIEPLWLVLIVILLGAMAWLWRQANRLSGGWLPSILSHSAADLTIMLAVFWRVFGG